MRLRPLLLGSILAICALSASAYDRIFPSNAKRGVVTFANYPQSLTINTIERQPAPGLRIWNTHNMILIPTQITEQNLVVNYTEDPFKLIDRVWLLTESEAAKPAPDGSMQSGSSITVVTPKQSVSVTNTPTTTTITTTPTTTGY